MPLVGTYELNIDGKNRLAVPFAVRRGLSDRDGGHSMYVAPGRRPGTLSLVPRLWFEKSHEDDPDGDVLSEEAYEWRQFELSNSALLDPDSQGRLTMPDKLLTRAAIGREVSVIGVGDRLEIWNRSDYEAFMDSKWPQYPQMRSAASDEINQLKEKAAAQRNGGKAE